MPEKPLWLSRHARNKCRHWSIGIREIEEALDNPEGTMPSIKNRVNYWRRWRNAWLRVTMIEEADRIVIVSATP